jgi:F-type H+-transporting ATPase subunit gamma
MPSLKIIRTRIASVKSTQKITKAMKMVAGARLNRAQQRIVALRPYAVKTGEILESVAAANASAGAGQDSTEGAVDNGAAMHPLLAHRPEQNVLLVLFTADRGLCGAFNTNVLKAADRQWRALTKEGKTVQFVTIGRKGKEFIARRGGTLLADFPKPYEALDLAKAREVATRVVSRFQKKEVDAVYFVYNEFKSAITQKITLERLLPLPEPADHVGSAAAPKEGGAPPENKSEFIFEPDRTALLQELVPMYVEITIYRAMLETIAGFFGAQMTAMDAATRNAKDMIGRLTLVYNRARQAAITKELMEIIGGAEALKE